MKLIAHRALYKGPNPEMENSPNQIVTALNRGFDAEIDVWLIDGKWWLGHDGPSFFVTRLFLDTPGLWLHCKNLEAFEALSETKLNCFWHQEDDFTLTRSGHIWTYPGKPLTKRSVMVQPEWNADWRETIGSISCFGICSKFVKEIESIRGKST